VLAEGAARRRGWVPGRRSGARTLIGLAAVVISAPADAQVGALASVYSDDRFRGISVSEGRPVGIVDLSYDTANGLYAGLSGTVVLARHDRLEALSVILVGGYATRFGSGLTADLGFVHSRYSHYSGVGTGREYNEIYAALSGKLLGGRISVSPNYLGKSRWTAHGEVFGHLDLTRATSLSADLGVLLPVQHTVDQTSYGPQLDARVGIAHRIGRTTLHADVTGRSGSSAFYGIRGYGRVALVLGISTAF
jgi:hypothetical protein